MRVELARRAQRDYLSIAKYIHAAGSESASLWLEGLMLAVLSLSSMPQRGALVPEDKRFRQILHGNKPHLYRILYSIDREQGIVFVRTIRHGARRPIR